MARRLQGFALPGSPGEEVSRCHQSWQGTVAASGQRHGAARALGRSLLGTSPADSQVLVLWGFTEV